MTDVELFKQIKDLRHEIEGLNESLQDLEVSDVVSGSSSEFPYQPRRFVISGIDGDKAASLEILLRNKLQQLIYAVRELEQFLDGVEDAKIRNILRLRYELGLSWNEVAIRCDSTEDAVRKKAERFFQNVLHVRF